MNGHDPGIREDRIAERDEDIETLLERYSDERLAPTRHQLTSMRAQLVQSYVGRPWAESRAPRRGPGRLWRWALAATTAIAALAIGTSFAAAESGPGQPFYHARLTLESLTLPAQGSARVQALLQQLDARLAEARSAGQRGDRAAVADAVEAYDQTLDSLSASLDAGSDQFVLDELGRHETVLQDLIGQVPPQAQSGLQHALDQAQHAKDAIGHRPATPGRGPAGPNKPTQSPPVP